MNRIALIYTFAIILLALSAKGQSNIFATAEVDRDQVMTGDSATYSIRILNATSLPNINAPAVEGLRFSRSPSQSTQTQIINGRTSIEARLSWSFTPVKVGDFTIPGRTIRVKGEDIKLPDVNFTAIPESEEKKSRHFLILNLEEQSQYFVGQVVQGTLMVAIRSDIDLADISLPESTGDAFKTTELSRNPKRSQTRIDGRIYNTFTWPVAVTPLKSGNNPINYDIRLTLRFSSPDDRMSGFFSLSRSRTESVIVTSKGNELSVVEIPQEGRPESYGNAIGQFDVTAQLSTRELTVGEPMTLTLHFEGTGNFDGLSAPVLPEFNSWRTYPPKFTFTPSDELGINGKKSFEYILIPGSVNIATFPEIGIAHFDPAQGDFITTVLESETVEVKPSPVTSQVPVLNNENGTEGQQIGAAPTLMPIASNSGNSLSSPHKLISDRLIILNSAIGLSYVAFMMGLIVRKRSARNPHLAQSKSMGKQLQKVIDVTETAAKEGDAQAFYENTQLALRLATGKHAIKKKDRKDPRSLVEGEIKGILRSKKLPEEILDSVCSLMQEADEFQFAGLPATTEHLIQKHKELREIILNMETKS